LKLQQYLDKRYTKEEQKNLTKLDCSNINLTSLKGIENLTNLRYLNCRNNKIIDLRLDKLERLCTDIKYKSIEEERHKQKLLRRVKILKNYAKYMLL